MNDLDFEGSLPDTSSTVRVRGLGARAEIWRDPQGIPHVRAASEVDAFFAQGWVHAQDRLWQMEYDRRRAYGRWAELAGPAALAQDVQMRRFRLEASARADYAAASADTRAMLDAYAAGVNALVEGARALPVEFGLVGARARALAAVGLIRRLQGAPYPHGHLADQGMAGAAGPPSGRGARGRSLSRHSGQSPAHHSPWGRVRGTGRPRRRRRARGAERGRGRAAGSAGMGSGQQQLGGVGAAHRVRQAPGGGRSPSPPRRALGVLPESHRLSRVGRHRPLLRRGTGAAALRPQCLRRLVRHPCPGGLPGPLHRALRSRGSAPLRVPGRLARGRICASRPSRCAAPRRCRSSSP